MKVVLDTNVLIAAFLTNGVAREALQRARRRDTVYWTTYLQTEFERVLKKKIGVAGRVVKRAMALLDRMAHDIVWTAVKEPIANLRDHADWPVLWFCNAIGADLLVTGDGELLALKRFHGCKILSPREYLADAIAPFGPAQG